MSLAPGERHEPLGPFWFLPWLELFPFQASSHSKLGFVPKDIESDARPSSPGRIAHACLHEPGDLVRGPEPAAGGRSSTRPTSRRPAARARLVRSACGRRIRSGGPRALRRLGALGRGAASATRRDGGRPNGVRRLIVVESLRVGRAGVSRAARRHRHTNARPPRDRGSAVSAPSRPGARRRDPGSATCAARRGRARDSAFADVGRSRSAAPRPH